MATPFQSGLSTRQLCESRLNAMRTWRYSWWLHWRELASYILPRRYRWLVTPNEMNRGVPINGLIIDSTGTLAAKNCAAGIMSGVTSPSRPWFKLYIEGLERDGSSEGALWLDTVERTMMRVLQESNFYNAIAVVWSDLTVFGTAVMFIYEDFDDVIRCYNPCIGEFYLANSDRQSVDSIYREYTQTTQQIVERWGSDEKKVGQSVKTLWETGGAGLAQEHVLCCAIEPNWGEVPARFAWKQVVWNRGDSGDKTLEVTGFYEMPAIAVRWDVEGNDAYGRCPGMDALGDIKQLQHEQRRKGQAIDKMVNPPLIGDMQMKNQPSTVIPGGISYVNGLISTNSPGLRPIYQVQPQLEHMMQDIQEVQQRINRCFFNDLFLMISQLDTVRTATEIDARREEKLVMLGPVLERLENEALDPGLKRIYGICSRAGIFPPPPESISGAEIKIQYISMLAQAQQAVRTVSIERVLGLAGNMTAVFPHIKDNIDADDTIREYGLALQVSPRIYNSPNEVAMKREAENAAMQQQVQAAQLEQMAEGAKLLSETSLDQNNALAAIIGR